MKTTGRQHMNPERVVLGHNERIEDLVINEKHIDMENGIHEVWFNKDVVEAYTDVFDDSINDHDKGKRKDRKIGSVENYMRSIEESKRGKRKTKKVNGKKVVDTEAETGKRLLYENVVSVGSSEKERDERGKTQYRVVKQSMQDRVKNGSKKYVGDIYHPRQTVGKHEIRPMQVPYEVNYRATKRFAMDFEKRNPRMKLVRVDWHADEFFYGRQIGTDGERVKEWAIPHAHIVWFPYKVGGYQRGMNVQQTISGALEQMGFVEDYSTGRKISAYEQWNKKEQAVLQKYIEEEYALYCQKHIDYYKEHGDLEVIHPDAGKDDVKNLSPSNYKLLKELENDIEELTDAVSEKQKEINDLEDTVAVLNRDKDVVESKMRTQLDKNRLLQKQVADANNELEFIKGTAKKDVEDAKNKSLKDIEDYKKKMEEEAEKAVADAVEQLMVAVRKVAEEQLMDCVNGALNIVDKNDFDMQSWAKTKTVKSGKTLYECYMNDRNSKAQIVNTSIDDFKQVQLDSMYDKLLDICYKYTATKAKTFDRSR